MRAFRLSTAGCQYPLRLVLSIVPVFLSVFPLSPAVISGYSVFHEVELPEG